MTRSFLARVKRLERALEDSRTQDPSLVVIYYAGEEPDEEAAAALDPKPFMVVGIRVVDATKAGNNTPAARPAGMPIPPFVRQVAA